jgi:hypothetical protein
MIIPTNTTVSQTPSTPPTLEIQTVSQINESYFFTIMITSQMNPIENVNVSFNGRINITNSLGIVGFTAPRVSLNQSNLYQITASKTGYISNTTDITVVFVPQLFPFVDSAAVTENTWFIVQTFDESGQIIDNVTIFFDDELFFTDENGFISLFAPSVSKANQYTITASKPGYLNYSIVITVNPSLTVENIIGFVFIVIIFIGLILVTFYVVIKKYFKVKRINKK